MWWRNLRGKNKLAKRHTIGKGPMVGMRLERLKKKKKRQNLRPVWNLENLENRGGHMPIDRDRGWTIQDPYGLYSEFWFLS